MKSIGSEGAVPKDRALVSVFPSCGCEWQISSLPQEYNIEKYVLFLLLCEK